MSCPICDEESMEVVFEYTSPPEGEVRFNFSSENGYFRHVLQCPLCGHYVSTFRVDTKDFYSGNYVQANYTDSDGMKKTFERIISLNPSCSDNYGRVRSIVEFAQTLWAEGKTAGTILDVGSGLGVFPYAMKKAGWDCTAIDPDRLAAQHISNNVGVRVILGDFMTTELNEDYDAVSFNKVLEHVEDPINMLSGARKNLAPRGFVYVEVPDGEMAQKEGKGREEFFIDHLHVFSFASTVLMAKKAGFTPLMVERVQEPSTKYTIRSFLV